MHETLDTQGSLHPPQRLGIEVLATTKSTATTTQSSIVRFAVIGMNFTLVTECRPRMLVLEPFPARTALRPFDLGLSPSPKVYIATSKPSGHALRMSYTAGN